MKTFGTSRTSLVSITKHAYITHNYGTTVTKVVVASGMSEALECRAIYDKLISLVCKEHFVMG